MNEKQLRANLLKNVCQIGKCGKTLNQYEIFCYRHWWCLPTWARYRYKLQLRRMGLDRTLDRTEAWKKTVQAVGIQEAGYLLGQHRDLIETLKSLIEVHLGDECAEKVRLSKWGKNDRFNESYNLDRTWL